MKKLFLISLLAVFAFSANAQKLEGTYIASDDFLELMNSYFDDDDIEVGLGIFFNGNDIALIIAMEAEAEGMEISCSITYPGKYIRTGNKFTCNFKKENVSFTLDKLRSNDPEIKEALEDEDTKDLLYKLVEGMMEESMEAEMDDLSVVCNLFSSFAIKSQTNEGFTMVLTEDDEVLEIGFTKL